MRKGKEARFKKVFQDEERERKQHIEELQFEEERYIITIRITKPQIKALTEYILLLPEEEFRLLAMFYCLRYTYAQIEQETGRNFIRGTIAYLKNRLTQCMNLPRPIKEYFWKYAVDQALDEYARRLERM